MHPVNENCDTNENFHKSETERQRSLYRIIRLIIAILEMFLSGVNST